jgi:hypothetical protein
MTPEVFFSLGAAVLLIVIIYGATRVARRNRRNDPITEDAVRELYKDPDKYERETREKLEKKLEPDADRRGSDRP